MDKRRYIFDALYGLVRFPEYVWETALTPEFQRLREVRMCNINSLCLTGGANINRYEHCLGVAHLAMECLASWPLRPPEEEEMAIILAALLHDIGSTAFGHSVQYVLDRSGFQHQSFLDIVRASQGGNGFAYKQTIAEPIYFGMPRRLNAMLRTRTLDLISEIVEGRAPYGPLISSDLDLDNLDNVYRLAYHIGLVRDGQKPLALARALAVSSGQLVIQDGAEDLVEDWYRVRKHLYEHLLLNPDEFSAKCMLQEALEIAEEKGDRSFRWNDVDFELLEKLSRCNDETNAIVARLAVGDLYGCVGLFSATVNPVTSKLEEPKERKHLERFITSLVRQTKAPPFKNAVIRIHAIKDVNKTQRQITLHTTSGRQIIVGSPTRRLLIGIFFKNVGLSMTALKERLIVESGLTRLILDALVDKLSDPNLEHLEMYSEISA